MLTNVMQCHHTQALALSAPETMNALAEEFISATGMMPRSMEHSAQIMEVYLQARLASLDCLDTDQLSVRVTYQSMLREIGKPVTEGVPMREVADPETMAPPPSVVDAAKQTELDHAIAEPTRVCLTPGVQLSEKPLTIQRLTEQFDAARDCDEPLHRSPANALNAFRLDTVFL